MKKFDKFYLKNRYTIFASNFPRKWDRQGYFLGLAPLKVRINKTYCDVQLHKDTPWRHLGIARGRSIKLVCVSCGGFVDYVHWVDGWYCDQCHPYPLTESEKRINRFRGMIQRREHSRLSTIRKGIVERGQAFELEGIKERTTAPIPLSEARDLQIYVDEPQPILSVTPPFEKGRLLWIENEYRWVHG